MPPILLCFSGNAWTQTNDRIFFDDLHDGFFRAAPNRFAPSEVEGEYLHPNTYFFEGHPIFLTGPSRPLNRSELHKAYNSFGQVHVADVSNSASPRYLTLPPVAPDARNAEQLVSHHPGDPELAKFVRHVSATERVYGPAFAAVVFGAKMTRGPASRRDHSFSYYDTVPGETARDAEPLLVDPSTTPLQLRQRLRREKILKVSSLDGLSSMSLLFNTDGVLEKGLWGWIVSDLLDFANDNFPVAPLQPPH